MGHEVHVVTSNVPSSSKTEIIEGVVIKRHDVIAQPLRNPISIDSLFLAKEFDSYDIIHAHDEHNFCVMMTAFLKRGHHSPLVITNHGQIKYGDRVRDAFVKIYEKSIGKFVLRYADQCVVNSVSDLEYLCIIEEKLRSKIQVIPNSIDPDEYNIQSSLTKDSFTKKYGLSGKKVILFVGQVIKRKGIQYLINAIPEMVNKTSISFSFLIIGMGEDFEFAKQLARQKHVDQYIVFAGEVSFEELCLAYKHSDIFTLPSLSEGLPTVILEAMFFELPIVATEIPGIKDHCSDLAYLVPPEDSTALADAYLSLLTDENLRDFYKKQGKLKIIENYTWIKNAQRYDNLYRHLIEG